MSPRGWPGRAGRRAGGRAGTRASKRAGRYAGEQAGGWAGGWAAARGGWETQPGWRLVWNALQTMDGRDHSPCIGRQFPRSRNHQRVGAWG